MVKRNKILNEIIKSNWLFQFSKLSIIMFFYISIFTFQSKWIYLSIYLDSS